MAGSTSIHFVNHASYIQRHGKVRLLVDPWITGDAFHHGWSLLAPTTTPASVLEDVTHIWVSHEHPDHFTPAFFKSIPKERRGSITVLYQTTKDRKVVKFVEGLGFRVVELPNGSWHRVDEDFEVLCEPVPVGDSFLVTRSGGKTIVNMNDCAHVTQAQHRDIKRRVGHIDVLFTQFGYASWQGAPEDTALRRELAAAQLDRISRQVETLAPTHVVPFASFIYFSAEDNAYINDANNRIDAVYRHIDKLGVRPIVLFPSDEWEVGATHDSTSAIDRWMAVFDNEPVRHKAQSVSLDELTKLAEDYSKRMRDFHSPTMIRMLNAFRLGFFGPISIYLRDHERAVEFSVFDGLRPTASSRTACDVTMHSETLGFVLKFDYGLNTLSVNGRMVTNTRGYKRLVRAFGLGTLKNDGRRFAPELLADRTIWVAASAAFFQRRA